MLDQDGGREGRWGGKLLKLLIIEAVKPPNQFCKYAKQTIGKSHNQKCHTTNKHNSVKDIVTRADTSVGGVMNPHQQ